MIRTLTALVDANLMLYLLMKLSRRGFDLPMQEPSSWPRVFLFVVAEIEAYDDLK